MEKNNELVLQFTQDSDMLSIYSKFKNLYTLVKGIPQHGRGLSDLELIVLQNYCYLCILLTEKQVFGPEHRNSSQNVVKYSKPDELETDFHELIHHVCQRVGNQEDEMLLSDDSNDDKPIGVLLQFLLSPFLSGATKLGVSNIIFMVCLRLCCFWKYKSAVEISSWFDMNSRAVFPVPVEWEPKEECLLLSDALHVRKSSELVYMFNIINSISHLMDGNYESSVICLQSFLDSQTDADEELVLLAEYVKALAHHRKGDYDNCIESLNFIISKPLRHHLNTNVHVLQAMSLSKKNKHHLSVQMLKRCLVADINNLIAVYLLSREYGAMRLVDAELRCLNILLEMLREGEVSSSSSTVHSSIFDIFRDLFPSNIRITLPQVLLLLASRCFELGRYEESSCFFSDLVASSEIREMTFSQQFVTSDLNESKTDIKSIYKLAIQANMKAEKYTNALDLCNSALKKCDFSNKQQNSFSSKKRKTNVNDRDADIFFVSEIDDVKSRIALFLEDYEKALKIISSAVISLEQHCLYGEGCENQLSKKRKLQGDVSEMASVSSSHLRILSDLYATKSSVLVKLKRFQEALHYSRLAHQITPDDPDKAFELSSILNCTGRRVEGAVLWLNFRNIPFSTFDKLQMNNLIEHKSKCLRTSEDQKLLSKDIECLNIICTSNIGHLL